MSGDPATRADLRDVADAVRDLASAQAASVGAREAIRAEGQARGETVVAQVATHHGATNAVLGELVRRTDALERAKSGAPWWLVSTLIVAIIVQGGVVLSLYARSNGDDASAAFRDGTMLVPSLPGNADGSTTESPETAP